MDVSSALSSARPVPVVVLDDGAATATEVQDAFELGIKTVVLFPALPDLVEPLTHAGT